jgi:hypothetical protein
MLILSKHLQSPKSRNPRRKRKIRRLRRKRRIKSTERRIQRKLAKSLLYLIRKRIELN